MDSPNTLILDHYFPSDVLKITEVIETDKIIIHMKSLSKTCICPRCHQTLKHYHGTYTRKVQDLPILEKMFSSGLKPMSTFVTMKRARLEPLLKHSMAFLMQTEE